MVQSPPGFQAVVRDQSALPFEAGRQSCSLDDLVIPDSVLIQQAKQFLRPELGEQIWNHSHRAFLFATAIAKTKLSNYIEYDAESFYLSCLFHDLGCTPKNIARTRLSFEFFGGIEARQVNRMPTLLLCDGLRLKESYYEAQWLLQHGASADLADAVAEAIFRHTDFNKGKISCNGQLIQLGTMFDNIHAHAEHLPEELVSSIVAAYPRPGWGGCFAGAMQNEVDAKPWSHATEIRESEAWGKILTNDLAKAD